MTRIQAQSQPGRNLAALLFCSSLKQPRMVRIEEVLLTGGRSESGLIKVVVMINMLVAEKIWLKLQLPIHFLRWLVLHFLQFIVAENLIFNSRFKAGNGIEWMNGWMDWRVLSGLKESRSFSDFPATGPRITLLFTFIGPCCLGLRELRWVSVCSDNQENEAVWWKCH